MGFQQLFHRLSTKRKAEKDDVTKTLRSLIDARFDRLEQNQRTLELEWADVYDKLMLLYDRTRKRISSAKKAAEEKEPVTLPTAPISRQEVLASFLRSQGDPNGRS